MKFTIGFEKEDVKTLHTYWDEIIANQQWTEGKFIRMFEEKWAEYVGVPYAVAFSSWFGAAMAALEYFNPGVVGCPSNTFMATPLSIKKFGAGIQFFDCNKYDLCLSADDVYIRKAAIDVLFVVHIGGHIAFDISDIVRYCKENNIILLEDCAHAHGAHWNGRKAGIFGNAGIFSFYATKTITTGEGGMLVTDNQSLYEFAKYYRNYGKPSYLVEGGNYRMSEFTAVLGIVQTERLDDIVAWKNEFVEKNLDSKFSDHIEFPDGMVSGYYKYIVFDKDYDGPVTGAVYDQPCHRLLKKRINLPNTDWIAKRHKTIPLYYHGEEL